MDKKHLLFLVIASFASWLLIVLLVFATWKAADWFGQEPTDVETARVEPDIPPATPKAKHRREIIQPPRHPNGPGGAVPVDERIDLRTFLLDISTLIHTLKGDRRRAECSFTSR
ncbi:hypothetical protein GTR04_4593 [Trichophyton interdigitale]|uniref:Uncharacterized protein n=1 Tax=Trichophyton interdigitale TaxID=101480 RepID=A0A9P5CUC0_9EURO|nr:hypothetical protein GY631_4628 [Trichophyton interdigitale]KAF3892210.1 hypothetical protein GY632_4762 [Trichophyton interdigitale]KAG8208029.1 hypothetical protein GTR04_4593 [Trichophyton interdigitale]